MWNPMIRIIVYPLLSLFTTSFYLSWIGVPFSSIIQYDDSDTESADSQSFILNYSILWLSYIYGYFPDVMYHRNTLYFKAMQPNRGIYLKQSLVKCIISNFVQTLAFCVCTLMMWWMLHLTFWDCQLSIASSWSIFGILWRITWTLNFLWIISYLVMNRLLTEKADLSRFNGCKHPLISGSATGRSIDIRMMALTHSHLANHDNEDHREYFANLALLELLDVVQFDPKQRKLIYGTQIYYNLLIETLLAEYTTFITALYEYLYGPNSRKNYGTDPHRPLWTNCCGSYLYRTLSLQPEMKNLLRNYQGLIRAADILSFLVVHSLEEDELGIVQESLEQILAVLLECLDILEIYQESNVYRDCIGHRGVKTQRVGVINCLWRGIETALMRIVKSMHSHLTTLKLPEKNAKRLQKLLKSI